VCVSYYDRAKLLNSKSLFVFWGGVLGIGTALNAMIWLLSRTRRSSQASTAEGTKYKSSRISSLITSVRAGLTTPATFGYSFQQHGVLGNVPLRLETLTLFAYFAINFILCAVSYDVFSDNLYYPDTASQFWRYFADRTGYLAYTNLPILWLFAIRNNILIWLTGWDFATYNRFHRWVARIATLEAILHSIGYTVGAFLEGGYADFAADWKEQYW